MPWAAGRPGPGACRRVDGRPAAGGSGTRTILVPLPHARHPVGVFLAGVADVGGGGFEDPQA
jgi:hypothetical protein